MNSTLFTDAMAHSPIGDGAYDGELNEHWTIGPKVHGGAMLALCANAVRTEHSRGLERRDSGDKPSGAPIAVSGNFLRVLCTTVQIGQDWFDEDHIVVDCEGHIGVQSRQLAMVPPPQ